jgi:cytochrome oxidase Cu insertion factor (SCO1/SenC/PrrC family)
MIGDHGLVRGSLLAAGISLLFLNIAAGQGPAREKGRQQNLLARSGLKLGDPLPDVTAYDADGHAFRLRSLKGHYAVLVFGCLT